MSGAVTTGRLMTVAAVAVVAGAAIASTAGSVGTAATCRLHGDPATGPGALPPGGTVNRR
ncbi:hypothetical protein ACU610_06050 [Geodermatophilus sp. URMC 61]|uniref:hypothetical protein n=1 Tax=Geodermatophilus sp. URMC 61 TaxID=3423411 RepID=UPI00406D2349